MSACNCDVKKTRILLLQIDSVQDERGLGDQRVVPKTDEVIIFPLSWTLATGSVTCIRTLLLSCPGQWLVFDIVVLGFQTKIQKINHACKGRRFELPICQCWDIVLMPWWVCISTQPLTTTSHIFNKVTCSNLHKVTRVGATTYCTVGNLNVRNILTASNLNGWP